MLKSKSKKKERKKKFNKILDIQPQKHKRTDNSNYYSEEVAKLIIDKIISLSFTKLFNYKIEKDISKFCITQIQKTINNLMQVSHIDHDTDDIYYSYNMTNNKNYSNSDEKRFKLKRHIKANKKKKQIAELDLLNLRNKSRDKQIEMVIKEKHFSDFLSLSFEKRKNIYIKSPNKIKYDTEISKKNIWGFINEPKSLSLYRFASHSNNVFPVSQLSNQIKETEESLTKTKTKFYNYYKSSTNKIKKLYDKEDEIPLKKRIFTIFQMNSLKKIEDKSPKPNEPENINELRKQKMEEIEKLKEEEIIRKQKLKSKKIIDKTFNLDKVKINFTDKRKNISIKEQKRYIEEQIKKGNFTTDSEGNIILLNEIKPDKLVEDLPLVYSKFKDVYIPNSLPKEKKSIDSEIHHNTNNINKMRKIGNFDINMPEYLKYKIEPSGSNFDLINPEIGVIIHEKTKSKSGGIKFFDKYHKFSMNDYNNTLKETLDNEKNNFKEKILENFNKTGDLKKLTSIKEKFKKMNENNFSTIKDEKKLFEKTFTNGLRKVKIKKIKDYKGLNKSQSGILLNNKKYSLFEDLYVHDENEKYNNDTIFWGNNFENKNKRNHINNIKVNQKNLFLQKLNGAKTKNNSKNSFRYKLIDSFNKSIILGSRNISGFGNYIGFKNIKNFPIIPLKRNKSNLQMVHHGNATTTNFHRTRTKKNLI